MEPEQPTATEQVKDLEKPKTWWINVRKKPSVLKFHPKNPRIINERGVDDMQKSISEFGFTDPPLVNLDNTIIAGHRRIAALLDWDLGDEEIDVRVPNRLLSREEHEKLMLSNNKMEEGHWNYDVLSTYEEEVLEEVGFTEAQLTQYAPIKEDKKEEARDEEPKVKKPRYKEFQCPSCNHVFSAEI